MSSFVRKIILIIAAMFLAGCASAPMAPEARAKIHKVSISKEVIAPKPSIYTPSTTAGAVVGGAIGAAIASSADDGSDGEKYLLSNHIDIKKIFRQDLIKELKARKLFTVRNSGKTDATIDIEITNYGFWLGGEFMNFDVVRPTLYVRLHVKDPAGQELWTGYDFVGNMSPMTDPVSIEEVMKKPALAEKSLRHASKLVAKLLVANMEGREVPETEIAAVKVSGSELLSAAKK